MSERLYEVTIEMKALVVASSEREAEETARECFDEMDGEREHADYMARPLTKLPRRDVNILPWGDESETRAEDWMLRTPGCEVVR